MYKRQGPAQANGAIDSLIAGVDLSMDGRASARRRDRKGGTGAHGLGILEGAFHRYGSGCQRVPRQMAGVVHGDHGAEFDVRDCAGGGIPHQIEHLGIALEMAAEHRQGHAVQLYILAAQRRRLNNACHRRSSQVRDVVAIQPEAADVHSGRIGGERAIRTEAFQTDGRIAVGEPDTMQGAGHQEVGRSAPGGVAAQFQCAAPQFRNCLLYTSTGQCLPEQRRGAHLLP